MPRMRLTGCGWSCCRILGFSDSRGRGGGGGSLRIWVRYDKDAGAITVADHGVGMSREEVIAGGTGRGRLTERKPTGRTLNAMRWELRRE